MASKKYQTKLNNEIKKRTILESKKDLVLDLRKNGGTVLDICRRVLGIENDANMSAVRKFVGEMASRRISSPF